MGETLFPPMNRVGVSRFMLLPQKQPRFKAFPWGEVSLDRATDEGLYITCTQSHRHPEWSAAQSKDLTHSSANCIKTFRSV